MKLTGRIILIIVFILIIAYLSVSAIYIFRHINFGDAFYDDMMSLTEGFSHEKNKVREFMGLSPTYSMNTSVPPTYLKSVAIRVFLIIVLTFLLIRIIRNMVKKDEKKAVKIDKKDDINDIGINNK